jgi:hypothetical protein
MSIKHDVLKICASHHLVCCSAATKHVSAGRSDTSATMFWTTGDLKREKI